MSFFAAPESSVGYSSYALPPRLPALDVEASDAESNPTGFCYTCLYWMFRSIPVLIFFLMINCVRAILFDQRTAFTVINITLGLTLFAVITISLYTFISLKFYRLQQSQATFFPPNNNNNPIAIIGNSTQPTFSSSNRNHYAYDSGEHSEGQYHCTRCANRSSSSTFLEENTSASTSAGHSHTRHCPHNRTRPRKPRTSASDLPPKYKDLFGEEPPKYEELSAVHLEVTNEHSQNVDVDHFATNKPDAQLQWLHFILFKNTFCDFFVKHIFQVFICFDKFVHWVQ